MGNNTWANSLDPFPLARGAAVNTFTSAKDVSPTPLMYTYGSELKIGTKVQLEAVGEFSTTGTPTLRLGFAYGITSAPTPRLVSGNSRSSCEAIVRA